MTSQLITTHWADKCTSEGDVKTAVKEVLKTIPYCWYFMPPANGYGRSGIPDFVGCVNGRFFAIETKFGKGKTTVHQGRELAGITDCKGEVWVVYEHNMLQWEAQFRGWVALCS